MDKLPGISYTCVKAIYITIMIFDSSQFVAMVLCVASKSA